MIDVQMIDVQILDMQITDAHIPAHLKSAHSHIVTFAHQSSAHPHIHTPQKAAPACGALESC
jgi:hypothetical protein